MIVIHQAARGLQTFSDESLKKSLAMQHSASLQIKDRNLPGCFKGNQPDQSLVFSLGALTEAMHQMESRYMRLSPFLKHYASYPTLLIASTRFISSLSEATGNQRCYKFTDPALLLNRLAERKPSINKQTSASGPLQFPKTLSKMLA